MGRLLTNTELQELPQEVRRRAQVVGVVSFVDESDDEAGDKEGEGTEEHCRQYVY